jgi:ATP-dependent Lhr-like helicase
VVAGLGGGCTTTDEPWPILGQQILVATLERGEWPVTEVVSLLVSCFPELPSNGIRSMIDHMIQQAYLDSAEGLVRIGPEAERESAVATIVICWRPSVALNF